MDGAIVKYIVYGTNDKTENPPLTITSNKTDNNASLVNFIDSFLLSEVPSEYTLSNFLIKRSDVYPDPPLKTDDGKTFIRKLTKEEVLSVPDFYTFYLQRPDPITNLVLTKPIYPDEHLLIGTKTLYLYAVVIHEGEINSGHYLVYFKYNEAWWIYNDLSNRIRQIGDFDAMLNREPSPTSRGVIYFYSSS